jgi:hypothetical protein
VQASSGGGRRRGQCLHHMDPYRLGNAGRVGVRDAGSVRLWLCDSRGVVAVLGRRLARDACAVCAACTTLYVTLRHTTLTHYTSHTTHHTSHITQQTRWRVSSTFPPPFSVTSHSLSGPARCQQV